MKWLVKGNCSVSFRVFWVKRKKLEINFYA